MHANAQQHKYACRTQRPHACKYACTLHHHACKQKHLNHAPHMHARVQIYKYLLCSHVCVHACILKHTHLLLISALIYTAHVHKHN